MNDDLLMVGGFYPKKKRDGAPDFVMDGLSINVGQFREWMKEFVKEYPDKEWLNIDNLVSKGGKGYSKVDMWEPDPNKAKTEEVVKTPIDEDDLPF